jgi:cation:H+ antiporter
MINIILMIVGFLILIKGADIFVDGASSLASNFKISKVLIGLTIVAFGTSAPELAVSIKSMISGNGDIVLGNVIGSNIFNSLLILGVASIIYPLTVKKDTTKKEMPLVFLVTLIFCILISDNIFDKNALNILSRSDGIVIVLFFTIFLYYLFSIAFKDRGLKEIEKPKYSLSKSIIFTILGIVAIIIGSNEVVDGAVYIAQSLGVSEKIIALTIVAFGTSLPELVTSVVASIKHEADIAVGNVIGSNIFNICLVLGIPTMIFGSVEAISFTYFDLTILLISSFVIWLFSFKDYKITKLEGFLLIFIFIIYYGFMFF